MIDGVDIDVKIKSPEVWKNSVLLNFTKSSIIQDDKLIKEKYTAKYRGLIFTIKRKYTGGFYYNVSGSLHKYYNYGRHNANDFSFEQFVEVLRDFKKDFGIDPNTAILHGLEFGFNLNLLIKANEFLKLIACMSYSRFEQMNFKKLNIGKVIERADYNLKFYDKFWQTYGKKNKELFRFEIVVKKMRYLKKIGIKTLSDLTDLSKITQLEQKYTDVFNDLVMLEPNINTEKLSLKNQLFYCEHTNPLFWENLETAKERQEHKEAYEIFFKKHGKQSIKEMFLTLFYEKMHQYYNAANQYVTEQKRQKNTIFAPSKNPFIRFISTPLKFAPFIWTVQACTTKVGKLKTKELVEQNKCTVCGSDISHKKQSAKYCSAKCKNKANNQIRAKRTIIDRIEQQFTIGDLMNILPSVNTPITIIFEKLKIQTLKRKKSFDIKHFQYKDFRTIKKVKFKIDNKAYEFTNASAKELIRAIINSNRVKQELKQTG